MNRFKNRESPLKKEVWHLIIINAGVLASRLTCGRSTLMLSFPSSLLRFHIPEAGHPVPSTPSSSCPLAVNINGMGE